MLPKRLRVAWRWPAYPRTTEEFTRPFKGGWVPDLKLELIDRVSLESPYWSMAGGDPGKFVELYVPSVMAWMGPYLEETLPIEVVDYLEAKLYTEVMANPNRWRHDFDQT